MFKFELGQQLKSREARDHFRAVLDAAEAGHPVIIRRKTPVVVMRRDVADAALAGSYVLSPKVSVAKNHVAMWVEGLPVHAEADAYDVAEEELLDALVDYAESWSRELRHAPNHAANEGYVRRVLMYAGDREELRRVVFDD